MEAIARDVRLAVRRLRMAPGFTIFAIVSLALGIGVSTAIYSAVRTLLWTPLGIAEPARAVSWTAAGRPSSVSWPDFVDIRAQQASFTSVGAARMLHAAVALGDTVETVFGESVSGDYFATLGVNALHGRVLQPQDEASRARVAVVSEAWWRTRLGADPAAIGRSVKLGAETFEIVGVARGTFHGVNPFIPGSVWIPEVAVPDRARTGWPSRQLTDRRLGSFSVWGRLKAGVSLAQARAEAAVIGQRLDVSSPLPSPLAPGGGGPPVKRAWVLREATAAAGEQNRLDALGSTILLAVVTVLLIACTNLANLSLAKGTSRAQETAVRTALGASRLRLIREHLVESAIVTACGGALGLVLLAALTDWFATDLPIAQGMVVHFAPEVSMEVLMASAAATVLALLVFGLWPAVQSTRHDLRAALGAGGGATPPRWRLHRSLVAWQVGGSVALLLVATMCAKVVVSVSGRDPGVDYRHLALAQIDFAINGHDETRARLLVDRIVADTSRQPGIESVSASTGLPFGVMAPSMCITTEDQPFTDTRDVGECAHRIAATPEVLRTLGIRMIHGRAFTDRDDGAAPRVAILSEALSRAMFHTTDVVGRRIFLARQRRLVKSRPPELFTVVGVSSETDTFMLGRRGNPVLFVPLAQGYTPAITISARTANPRAATGILRSAIRRADPELAVSALGTGTRLLAGPYFLLRIVAGLASALGALALVLAMAGLYGVLAHVVTRRTREIGIRLAMGADRARIFKLVLRDGFGPVVYGLVLGLGGGVVFRLALRLTVVTDISPVDPWTFGLVPVPFAIAALVACYVPASRASRVEPVVALRDL